MEEQRWQKQIIQWTKLVNVEGEDKTEVIKNM
jgi:hypothetical protein